MNNVLAGFEPQIVWRFFEEYAAVPHGSLHLDKANRYLTDFAVKHKLEHWADEYGNVIIKKPGTKGYENSKTVLLQAHMDMVCEKEADKEHDFENDGLTLMVEDDYLHADGTTLGGDNGAGLAYMLAVLASDNIAHPPLECAFTADEEIGLVGASKLDCSQLKSQYMINTDTQFDDVFTISCSGGLRYDGSMPVSREKRDGALYRITMTGLKGGHSGADINLGRANADILMGSLLKELNARLSIGLISIEGGRKGNAIPRFSEAEVVINAEDQETFLELVEKQTLKVREDFKVSDPDGTFIAEPLDGNSAQVVSQKNFEKILVILTETPDGVQAMSREIEGLVQTSLNMGITRLSGDQYTINISLRSCVEEDKRILAVKVEKLLDDFGFTYKASGDYPGWMYDKNSPFIKLLSDIYEKMFEKKPVLEAVHGGIECGIFGAKIPGLDIVSIGPNLWNPHTPSETLSISSTKRMWEFLLEVLKTLK